MTELFAQNEDFLRVYLVPALYLVYALFLLSNPPAKDSSRGMSFGRAKKSPELWKYTQKASGLYCLIAGAALIALVYFLHPVFWLQVVIEVAVIAGMVPVVIALQNKKFPEA